MNFEYNTNILISEPAAPWRRHYGDMPFSLDYPDCSMFDMVEKCAADNPDYIAYDFLGKNATYASLISDIKNCAKAFKNLGITKGDKVTICLPNIPQAIIAFYALNFIGALPSMIHPLSSAGEIKSYLNISESIAAITLDAFYGKFESVRKETGIKHLIIANIPEALPALKSFLFKMTKGRKIKPIPKDADVIFWGDFIASGNSYSGGEVKENISGADPAAIFYSGGTTGTSKGILLSNLSFNALAMQMHVGSGCVRPKDSILTVMPVFHGFGLGVSVHLPLIYGMKCILIPQFSPETYGKIVKKSKPNIIAGVPTLYEAMISNPVFKNADLSFLKGIFCGGDTLSVESKRKIDAFLKDHNCKEQIREGYGMTESVTGSCLCPKDSFREGSVGIPLPDMYYKIVQPLTTQEVPIGTDGEICVCGPTVMMGYINNREENAQTLQIHDEGNTWLHTGDLGCMDADGFVYFRQRLKRMIITSGYNVYPSQLENVIEGHNAVLCSCVIGVPDPYRIQKVKAFVVLKPEYRNSHNFGKIKDEIYKHCQNNIAKYAMPYEFEYRDELPRTLVGKVAYTVLEQEEMKRIRGL